MSRPSYTRAMLTDPTIRASTTGGLVDNVDCGPLQTQERGDLFVRVRRNLRRRQTEALKAGRPYPYQITIGEIAGSLSVAPEEVAEAILGWGYWVGFHRDPAKPVAQWIVDEDGE